ncbi:MAG: hypothetical protein H0U76_09700 [Ktedonobacteraceae bacterium]|nr:hypothetical protein [Ktedonobacteraceae bacterium]
MLLGLPIAHILLLTVLLISIVLPFTQVTHALHARTQIVIIMLLTLICFVVFLLLGHAPARSDLVLLRCYACSSAFGSLIDALNAARDEKKPLRLNILAPLAVIFLLALVCLIGGINGAF